MDGWTQTTSARLSTFGLCRLRETFLSTRCADLWSVPSGRPVSLDTLSDCSRPLFSVSPALRSASITPKCFCLDAVLRYPLTRCSNACLSRLGQFFDPSPVVNEPVTLHVLTRRSRVAALPRSLLCYVAVGKFPSCFIFSNCLLSTALSLQT